MSYFTLFLIILIAMICIIAGLFMIGALVFINGVNQLYDINKYI